MIGALHMLGALSPRGLRGQVIVARVNDVDEVKFARALTQDQAAVALPALRLADVLPKVALDAVAPLAKRELRDRYGVDADFRFADAPPPLRSRSEFLPGAAFGAVLVGLGYGVYRLVRWLV